jgi:integrase
MKTYIELSEVEELEKAASNPRDNLLISFLFHLGCRISEALALKVRGIDLGQGTIRILHLKRQLRLSCPNCGARLGQRLLQEHLGHASFNTTAKYRKVSGKEHRDWYKKLWKEETQ